MDSQQFKELMEKLEEIRCVNIDIENTVQRLIDAQAKVEPISAKALNPYNNRLHF